MFQSQQLLNLISIAQKSFPSTCTRTQKQPPESKASSRRKSRKWTKLCLRQHQDHHNSLQTKTIKLEIFGIYIMIREDGFVNLSHFLSQQQQSTMTDNFNETLLLTSINIINPSDVRMSQDFGRCKTVCACNKQVLYVSPEIYVSLLVKHGAAWVIGFLFLCWNAKYWCLSSGKKNSKRTVYTTSLALALRAAQESLSFTNRNPSFDLTKKSFALKITGV